MTSVPRPEPSMEPNLTTSKTKFIFSSKFTCLLFPQSCLSAIRPMVQVSNLKVMLDFSFLPTIPWACPALFSSSSSFCASSSSRGVFHWKYCGTGTSVLSSSYLSTLLQSNLSSTWFCLCDHTAENFSEALRSLWDKVEIYWHRILGSS